LTARLKLPHGQLNPDGFDAEAWWLTEGIRANGFVRSDPPLMLGDFVFSARDAVGRARHALRERIQHALPDARFASVIIALVIGDQRGIEAADWEVFNRTGIGHLISISGLHITMIAALFSGLVHFLWRHSFFTNAQLPLRPGAQGGRARRPACGPSVRCIGRVWDTGATHFADAGGGRVGSVVPCHADGFAVVGLCAAGGTAV